MRYDLLSPREGKEKTYWHKIGAAFSNDKGGFSLVFDSLPLPDKEGNVRVIMSQPREKTEKLKEPNLDFAPRDGSEASCIPDDSIPF